MAGENTRLSISSIEERQTEFKTSLRLNASQKFANFLRAVKEKLSELERKSAENHEREIIETQRKVYGMGEDKNLRSLFNYDKVESDPTYCSQVLEPFIGKLKQSSKMPLVLDLGAGHGETSDYMDTKGIKTVRVDISSSGLRWQKNAVQATAWKLPFSANSIDGIHCKDMLTHIPPEYRKILFSELNRVMRHGGIAIICSVGEMRWNLHQYFISKEDLIKLVKKEGFTIENDKQWSPDPKFRDWYVNTNQQRFILELRSRHVLIHE